jgi:hypothetical protein
MKRASFINHKVTPEGVYVRGLTAPGLTPDVEILVPRDDAEEFGWIDGDTDEPTEASNAEEKRLRTLIDATIFDLEVLISAHDMDMTQRAFEKVQDILATLKRSIAPEKPVDPEQDKMSKKLAEWNAMSQH